MSRIEKIHQYWQQQEPTVESMYLRRIPPHFDKEEIAEIVSYLPDLNGKKILDLATGIGRFIRHFSTQGQQIVAVDSAPHFLEKNRQDHSDCKNVSFLCSNVMDLQFKEEYFDFVFINGLLIYLGEKEVKLLIQRIHTWLKPEGKLFFRETCNIKKSVNRKKGYYAEYRPLSFYDRAVEKKFHILKEGHMQTFVNHFANPYQSFWLCEKNAAI